MLTLCPLWGQVCFKRLLEDSQCPFGENQQDIMSNKEDLWWNVPTYPHSPETSFLPCCLWLLFQLRFFPRLWGSTSWIVLPCCKPVIMPAHHSASQITGCAWRPFMLTAQQARQPLKLALSSLVLPDEPAEKKSITTANLRKQSPCSLWMHSRKKCFLSQDDTWL